MCTTRSWNNFNIVMREKTGEKFIYAIRSDGQMLAFINNSYDTAADFVEELETYRNCECTQEKPCNKHIDKKET